MARTPDLHDLLRAQAQDPAKTRSQLPPWLRGDIPERPRPPQKTYADPTATRAIRNLEPRKGRPDG